MKRSLIVTPGECLAERAEKHAGWLRQCVRPIFQAGFSGQLEGLGSCVLLKSKDRRCFVTADHVIAANRPTLGSETSTLYFGPEDAGEVTQLSGKALSALRYDVAIVFEAAGLNKLPEERFVSLNSHLFDSRQPPYRFCLVLGYRAARRAINLNDLMLKARPRLFIYVGTVQELTQTHLKIQIDYKKVRRGGRSHQTGELHGISGGGVFAFDPLNPNAVPLLVGVVTDHKKMERHLLCTRTTVIRQILLEAGAQLITHECDALGSKVGPSVT